MHIYNAQTHRDTILICVSGEYSDMIFVPIPYSRYDYRGFFQYIFLCFF